jgi:hypothetical protein
MYVGFSRVTSPRDLCVLIAAERQVDRIEAIVDPDVVGVVQSIHVEASQDGGQGVRPGVGPDPDALYPSDVEGDPPLADPEGLGYAPSDSDSSDDGGQMSEVHQSSSAQESDSMP